ncbi:MAG: hypothetical protein NTY48_07340 [Candidatus Diapherotrites archaeon]|nr:hypothetical protein [Candidatus Diapherotrites archaeon]
MASTRKWVINPPGREENWGTIEYTKEGHKVKTRVNRIVTRMTRFGKRISLHQLSTVSESTQERILLQQVEHRLSQGKLSKNKLARLKAAKKVLTTSLQLQRHLGGRKSHMFHMLATIGLIYGFNSPEMHELSKHMLATTSAKRVASWEGDASQIRKALARLIDSKRNNWVSGIEEQLYSAKAPLTSKQLAARLKVIWEIKNKDLISASLQLLETAGLVKKLPHFTDFGTRKAVSVWVHKDYEPILAMYQFRIAQNTETHYYNPDFEILSQLYTGPKLTTQLYKEYKMRQKGGKYFIHGDKNAIYTSTPVHTQIKYLKKTGLIETNTIKEGLGGGPGLTEVLLTPLGRSIWKYTIETGNLSDRLIRILLGEKEE